MYTKQNKLINFIIIVSYEINIFMYKKICIHVFIDLYVKTYTIINILGIFIKKHA